MLFSFQRPQPSQAEPRSCCRVEKGLSAERPLSTPLGRPVSVDSPSGSYPILQLPLGQRFSVAPIFGSSEALADPSKPHRHYTGRAL